MFTKPLDRRAVIKLVCAVKVQAEKDVNLKCKQECIKPSDNCRYTAMWWLENRLPVWRDFLPEIMCEERKEYFCNGQDRASRQ